MKLNNKIEVNALLEAVRQAKGDVYLESIEGDRYNLKSELSQYIALGTILSKHGDNLELFCANSIDEPIFFELFRNFPQIL